LPSATLQGTPVPLAEQVSDPATNANELKAYAKRAGDGVLKAYIRDESSGAIAQIGAGNVPFTGEVGSFEHTFDLPASSSTGLLPTGIQIIPEDDSVMLARATVYQVVDGVPELVTVDFTFMFPGTAPSLPIANLLVYAIGGSVFPTPIAINVDLDVFALDVSGNLSIEIEIDTGGDTFGKVRLQVGPMDAISTSAQS
jgi:hypothetical protein